MDWLTEHLAVWESIWKGISEAHNSKRRMCRSMWYSNAIQGRKQFRQHSHKKWLQSILVSQINCVFVVLFCWDSKPDREVKGNGHVIFLSNLDNKSIMYVKELTSAWFWATFFVVGLNGYVLCIDYMNWSMWV